MQSIKLILSIGVPVAAFLYILWYGLEIRIKINPFFNAEQIERLKQGFKK